MAQTVARRVRIDPGNCAFGYLSKRCWRGSAPVWPDMLLMRPATLADCETAATSAEKIRSVAVKMSGDRRAKRGARRRFHQTMHHLRWPSDGV